MLSGPATAQTFTTLHNFTALKNSTNNEGVYPKGTLILSGSTLYGTAMDGGSGGEGTVFKGNINGTGFTSVDNFNLTTGGESLGPLAGVILSGNTLYGTTEEGGTSAQLYNGPGYGTVFKVNTDGTGSAILYDFSTTYTNSIGVYTNSDGEYPYAGLILSGSTLYGTTAFGGTSGDGTVFSINTNGTGFTVLHEFTGGSDGYIPTAGLILSGNTLYGIALGGTAGNGMVFALNTNGTGFTVLHNFTAGSDGANPCAGLILSGSTLYGTAAVGGTAGNGTVFALNTNGTGFTTLHSFTATSAPYYQFGTNSDGALPQAGLILSGSTLYGTATYGGTAGEGTIFAINTNGTGFVTLHSFSKPINSTNSDGALPQAGLILSGSTLYGTAEIGGTAGNGTVFSISLGSVGALQITTASLPNGTNGAAYSQTLAASGGQTPYSWTNSSGTLPPGLALTTNGVISGTPTTNGTNNFTVKVTDALSATATQALVLTVSALNLVVNGGFETGDFTCWTLSGSDTNDIRVDDGSLLGIEPHSGNYLAAGGPVGSLSFLSQTLSTTPGIEYLLSFWLDSPDGETPNEFLVSWNGNTLFDKPNLPAIGWTNIQFVVSATGTSTVLQFGFRDDPSFLGLDDISVVSLTSSPTPVILSAPKITVGKTNFTFQLSGPAGSNYVLQVSTNLLNWNPVSTSTIPVGGSINVTNAITNYNRRFYKVHLQ
jgi:uncharacterized repeat protein (TIGR03803 family)